MKTKGYTDSSSLEPMRVAVYARVSSDEQRESETIENQVHFAAERCRARGFTVVDFYKDDGVSGATPLAQRPEGSRLMADAKARKFDAVVFYRLDRLARSMLVMLKAQEELDQFRVGLVSLTEPFDASTPAGRMLLQLLGTFAEYEREAIKERTQLGKARRVREGKRTGARPLLGYDVGPDGHMVINPEQAEVIRTIYRLYVNERMNSVKIADYLTAQGIPTSATFKGTHKGHRNIWIHTRISEILRNPAYRGEFRYNVYSDKPVETASIPAIIPPDLWYQAEAIRKKNTRNAKRNRKSEYLLRGLIKCSDCGCSFQGCWVGTHKTTYYRCSGTENRHRLLPEKCRIPMVRTDQLDDYVWESILAFVRNPGDLLKELEERVKAGLADCSPDADELASLEASLESKKVERERVLRLFRKGSVSEAEADAELAQLEREQVALLDRKRVIVEKDAERQMLYSQAMSTQLLLASLHEKSTCVDDAERRELVELLVDSIHVASTINEQGKRRPKVTVKFRFPAPQDNKSCELADCTASNS